MSLRFISQHPDEDDLGIEMVGVSPQPSLDLIKAVVKYRLFLTAMQGAGSDTTSVKSSILRYREENGRTYHSYKDGGTEPQLFHASYVLPRTSINLACYGDLSFFLWAYHTCG